MKLLTLVIVAMTVIGGGRLWATGAAPDGGRGPVSAWTADLIAARPGDYLAACDERIARGLATVRERQVEVERAGASIAATRRAAADRADVATATLDGLKRSYRSATESADRAWLHDQILTVHAWVAADRATVDRCDTALADLTPVRRDLAEREATTAAALTEVRADRDLVDSHGGDAALTDRLARHWRWAVAPIDPTRADGRPLTVESAVGPTADAAVASVAFEQVMAGR